MQYHPQQQYRVKEKKFMGNVKKTDRVQDTDIKRLNHVGLSQKAIAEQLGCHAATVTQRLKGMGIQATDTRRSFMEQVFLGLNKKQREWLSHNLYNSNIEIKKFVITLIKEAYESAPVATPAAPAPMPKGLVGAKAEVMILDEVEFTPDEVEQEIVLGGSSPTPDPEDTVAAEHVQEMELEPIEAELVPVTSIFGK